MRGIWVLLTLLVAAAGGGASGYYANVQYGPRTSLHPLRVANLPPVVISVRRITYVAAAPERPEPRMSTPGIVDITPKETMVSLGLAPASSLTTASDEN